MYQKRSMQALKVTSILMPIRVSKLIIIAREIGLFCYLDIYCSLVGTNVGEKALEEE